jgi:hypothetical protein
MYISPVFVLPFRFPAVGLNGPLFEMRFLCGHPAQVKFSFPEEEPLKDFLKNGLTLIIESINWLDQLRTLL